MAVMWTRVTRAFEGHRIGDTIPVDTDAVADARLRRLVGRYLSLIEVGAAEPPEETSTPSRRRRSRAISSEGVADGDSGGDQPGESPEVQ